MTASLPSLPGEYFQHTSRLPVAIDYPAALALRQMAAQLDDYPKYLLAPEVSALLHYIPDLYRKTLVDTLWNSGARINEALALGRTDFLLQPLSVRTAGHTQTTDREIGENGRSCARRQPGSPAGTAFRCELRQSAGDDGGHAENPAGAAQ